MAEDKRTYGVLKNKIPWQYTSFARIFEEDELVYGRTRYDLYIHDGITPGGVPVRIDQKHVYNFFPKADGKTYVAKDEQWFEVNLEGSAGVNNFVNNIGFDTATGVLSLERSGLETLSKNLDGRYALLHNHPYDNYQKWSISVGENSNEILSENSLKITGSGGIEVSLDEETKTIDISGNMSQTHAPVTIADDSQNYASIGSDQKLSITPQPIATGETYYLHNNSSDITDYNKALKVNPDNEEQIDTANAIATGGEVLINEFATDIGYPGVINLLSGGWLFKTFAKVDFLDGVNEIVIRVFKRDGSGTETELFNHSVSIENTNVTLYSSVSLQDDFVLDVTDRLVFKYFFKTTSETQRTVSLYYEGSTNFSHIRTPIKSFSETAVNNYVSSIEFDTATGILTLGRYGLESLTKGLDGRYALLHDHPYDNYQNWNISDGENSVGINSNNTFEITGSGGITATLDSVNKRITIGGSSSSVSVETTHSLNGDGTASTPIRLDGDLSIPGNSKYYGTNGDGTKGWYDLPSGGASTIETEYSITGDGSTGSKVKLVNDASAPGNSKYYGTNDSGTKGWHDYEYYDYWNVKSINPDRSFSTRIDTTEMLIFTGTGGIVCDLSSEKVMTIDGSGIGGGVSDHGGLSGLTDDDHSQYHNDTRGDERYYTKTNLQTSGQASVHWGNLTNVVSISPQYSITGGGALTSSRTLNLVNDVETPGNSKYYGTNATGTKGWYDLPSGGTISSEMSVTGDGSSGSKLKLVNDVETPSDKFYYGFRSGSKGWFAVAVSSDNSITGQGIDSDKLKLVNDQGAPGANKCYSTNSSGTKGWYDLPTSGTIETEYSITGDGSTGTKVKLVNDSETPGNNKYYGTNASGTRGYYDLPTGGTDGYLSNVSWNDASPSAVAKYTVTGATDLTFDLNARLALLNGNSSVLFKASYFELAGTWKWKKDGNYMVFNDGSEDVFSINSATNEARFKNNVYFFATDLTP